MTAASGLTVSNSLLNASAGLTATTGYFSSAVTAASGLTVSNSLLNASAGLTATTGYFSSAVTAASGLTVSGALLNASAGLTATTGYFNNGLTVVGSLNVPRLSSDVSIDGNLRIGNSTTMNTLRFYGTSLDGPNNYTHTSIAEHIYSSGVGSESSELLLFKGNDTADRVRVVATGGFQVDIAQNANAWDPSNAPLGPTCSSTGCLVVGSDGNVSMSGSLSVSGTINANISITFPVNSV